MGHSEHRIAIYHTAWQVCLILAVVFVIVSIVLFFRFDIKNIFNVRMGRTIQKKE